MCVHVHTHPYGLEPVSTFAEPIIKFSPLVVGVRVQTGRQSLGLFSTWYPGERAEFLGERAGVGQHILGDRQAAGREGREGGKPREGSKKG